MKLFLSLLIVVLFQGCQPDNSIENTSIIWVNSAKIECTGVGKMTCMQIQKSQTLDLTKDWELFYSQIEGFDYQPGFIYKLKIKSEKIDNPPADGSSIKYILQKILEKKEDTRYAIHDIYVLTHINGSNIESDPIEQTPSLEINVSKMEVMGSNGCNNFGGSIVKLNETDIEFGPLRETMKMCQHMNIPNQYSKELGFAKTFKKEKGILYFYNSENKNTLTFKKVD